MVTAKALKEVNRSEENVYSFCFFWTKNAEKMENAPDKESKWGKGLYFN